MSDLDQQDEHEREVAARVRVMAEEEQPPRLAEILDAVAALLRQYIVMRPEAYDACALWAANTWVFDVFDICPYLEITSPVPRCGKTHLLELLEMVTSRPWKTTGANEATLFRKIEADSPTLLHDEVDALFGKVKESTEGVRGVLNAGFRRGGSVPRCIPPSHVVQDFNVYCPKAFAGIFGNTPDTIADRSILIQLHRRSRDEPISRFRTRRVWVETEPIRVAFAQWADGARDDLGFLLAETEVMLDNELAPLHDRAADSWEPLIALALTASEEWTNRAVAASLALSSQDEGISHGVQLLTDISVLMNGRDAIPTQELLTSLFTIETSPWQEWWSEKDRDGFFVPKKGAPRRLAQTLEPFGVRPRVIRVNDYETPRGYRREDFLKAWERYLPPDVEAQPAPLLNPQHPQQVTGTSHVADVAAGQGVRSEAPPPPGEWVRCDTHRKETRVVKVAAGYTYLACGCHVVVEVGA